MKKSAFLGAVGLIPFALSPLACHRGSDNAAVVTATPPTQTIVGMTLTASVTDAKSGALIPASLTLTGKDANLVVDGNGNSLFHSDSQGGYAGPITTGTAGVFAIPIKPTASTTYPLSLNLVVAATGYNATSQTVSVPQAQIKADGSGNLLVPISMVAVAAPPPTVSTTTATATASTSGTLSAPVTASTPTVTATVGGATVNLGSASVAIPTSTVVYTDATKTTPLTGALTVAVVYHNSATPDSLATYPGNFSVNVGPDGAALSTPGGLIAGALVSVTVTDASGRAAHSFTQPMNITATIPGSTNLPGSSPLRKVKAGDTIPVWAYDETHAAWTVQRDANNQIVTATLGAADANGNFPITFPTTHLSGFLPAWFQAPAVLASPTISVKGGQGLPLGLKASGSGWSSVGMNFDAVTFPDPMTFNFSLMPKPLAGAFTVTVNGTTLQTFTVADMSTNQTLDVTTAATAYLNTTKFATATVSVTQICNSNPSGPAAANSVPITAVSAGLPVVTATTNTSGAATLAGLQIGKTYTITATNRDGQVKTASLTVATGTNVVPTFQFSISCTGATGAN